MFGKNHPCSVSTFTRSRIVLLYSFLALFTPIAPATASYLHAKGAKLYNDKEETVRLTGVNWFGFETSNLGPHGLWARDYHGIVLQIKSLGFNCIRLPFCDAMFRDGAKVQSINFYGDDPFYPRDKTLLNKELQGLAPLQIMDEIIRYAGEVGLVIILDNHSRDPDGYMNEKVWYTESTSEAQWIADWVMLADRYAKNPAVTGFDLDNEPHGKAVDGGATWGTGNAASDWNVAAQKCGNAILAVNPDGLIIIEGVEQSGSTNYWWGGNLRGVQSSPIALSKPEKLVYSAHEYGPEVFQQTWFDDPGFPGNLEGIWNNAFGFIVKSNISPLFIGEFGIRDTASYKGKSGTWFTAFLKFMADNFYSWTFWCFNPNSGDTGGILTYDWISVEQWKVNSLKPWCAPLINTPTTALQKATRAPHPAPSLVVRNNRITCESKYASKLTVVSISGKLVASATSFPVATRLPAAGTYMAVLYQDAKVIERMTFTVGQ